MSEIKTLADYFGIDPKINETIREAVLLMQRRPLLFDGELYDIAAEIMAECKDDSIRRVKSALDYAENGDRRIAEANENVVLGIVIALSVFWRVCYKHKFMDDEMLTALSGNINAIYQMAENAAKTGEWSEPEFPDIPRIEREKPEAEE